METAKGLSLALTATLLLASAPSTRFGHRAYKEAPPETLRDAGRYRASGRIVRLRAPAADAFQALVRAARAEGVSIIPISGFRPVAYQKALFDRARRRYGSEAKAARWVAPPGHSEHATGWTLDLGDGEAPATDVETAFEETAAFRWLTRHAAEHHFELSFPRDNPQGVNYEPWHWRYVGDADAARLFHPERYN